MSYKNVLMAVVLVAVLMLFACSSVPKEQAMNVTNVSITGDAKTHMKVADGEYVLKLAGDKMAIATELELIMLCEMEEPPGIESGWQLVLLDNNGAALMNVEPFALTTTVDKIQDLLKGEVGDKVMVTFESATITDKAIQKMVMNEAAGFEIINANYMEMLELEEEETPGTVVTPKPKPPVTPPVTNAWDSVLDSYESSVNRLIVLSRKIKQGDPTAMTDFIKMKEQAEALDKRLGNAKDMTSAQMSRFLNLQQKMATALAS